MINRKILLMILFSFSAHLAVAAVIVYTPYDMIGNTMAGNHDTVIWGYVEGGEKSAKDGKRDSAINPVKKDKMKPEGNSIPPGQLIRADTDEIPGRRWLTKDDENNPPTPPLEKGVKGGFDLTEGQKGETGVTSVTSEGSDASDKMFCNTSEDCESVNLSNGAQGSNGFDKHALAEYVRKEIERYKYYPDIAKLKGLEGTVYINFYIGQDGTPSSISVARSSGFRILDDAGVKIVGMVGKISNLHKDLRELDIVVPITYKLEKSDK